jgi:hypothetical protein
MDDNVSKLPPLTKPLTDTAATSFTLSSDYYNAPELFELEKRQIFYKTWQYVAHESMLPDPGDYVSLRLCDESAALRGKRVRIAPFSPSGAIKLERRLR